MVVVLPAPQGLPPGCLLLAHSPSLSSLPSVPGSHGARQGPLTVSSLATPHPDPSPAPHLSPSPHSSYSTKQLLADIMQFHPGDSVKEMLSLSVSSSQVLYCSSPPHATGTADSSPGTPPITYHKQTPLLTSKENSGGPRPLPLTPETHRLRRAAIAVGSLWLQSPGTPPSSPLPAEAGVSSAGHQPLTPGRCWGCQEAVWAGDLTARQRLVLGRGGGRLEAWRPEKVVRGWGARGRSEDSARALQRTVGMAVEARPGTQDRREMPHTPWRITAPVLGSRSQCLSGVLSAVLPWGLP